MSILPGYCDKFVPECEVGILPSTLSSLFNEEFLELSYLELLKKCEESFCSITVTEQQAKHHEEATRDQADSKTWFQYRAGRVTASKFKAAAHTNKSSPSQSLLKTIISKDCHANLKIGCCGLVVHPCYPHLGASPDGIVICDCCGKGVLEIKCPYSCHGKAFSEAADQDKYFCLQNHANGHLQLIESHAYYQVQAQLKLCETVYCDFVMWSMDELLVL